jgi:nitronate monooxygenase
MIVESRADDIVYTPYFSGVNGNYLKPSVRAAGMDPENLPEADKTKMNFGSEREKPKAWKQIWSAGQGVGNIDDAPSTRAMVQRLAREYEEARQRLAVSDA